MLNTLHNNDVLLVKKTKNLNRYDIATVYSQTLNEFIVKRVIGVPGDTLRFQPKSNDPNDCDIIITDKNNNTFCADDSFTNGITSKQISEISILDDFYFFIGDNRQASYDSRDLGPLNKSQIVGKVIVYSHNKFALFFIKHLNFDIALVYIFDIMFVYIILKSKIRKK